MQGHLYDPFGPTIYEGADSKYFPRPAALLDGDKYYEKSKVSALKRIPNVSPANIT